MIARWQRHWHLYWTGFTHRQQIAATAAAVTALLGLALWPVVQFWGLPRLQTWRVDRTLAQANAFAAEQDYRNVLLAIRRASQLGSQDVAVWRRIADYLTQLGSPEALQARQTVTALDPTDLHARVELAQTALLFGDYKTSQSALEAAKALAPSSTTYQEAAATLALYLGDVDQLKTNLTALVSADPSNTQAAYDLAIARLWSPDATERRNGLDTLTVLLAQPELRVRVTLDLLKDTARNQDQPQLVALFPHLVDALDYPTAFTARTTNLNTLILGLKTTALDDPADVARVADWLADIRLGRDALQWVHTLPAELREHPRVAEIAAEISLREGIPAASAHYLLQNAFGDLPPEAAVLATGARQLEAHNRLAAAQAAWDEAINLASDARDPNALRVLARVGALWGRNDWTQQALRAALKRNPNAFWAYAGLRDQLLAADNANALWKLYQQWIERQPDDLTVVIQWIRLGTSLPQVPTELEREATRRLLALPASPRRDAALAGWHHLHGETALARELLQRAGNVVDREPDAAYWAALIDRPLDPNRRFPALSRLLLTYEERRQLSTDDDMPVGAPRPVSTNSHSLHVR
ncbi:tetratricopeptide repeat protein [Actomonas aquatica]|uniref:Tetratricopeptide repeat protein n=1 Tax=Actomonas aquatica TaxID=2866162 RepID=A0ABZ1CBN5_9BACT|nr:hypothetical protein [Opitutus sp. WL0086]WRQ88658.1 hypothetical protein K1X11_004530 [Opitutus sp. WL0086]